MLQDIDPQHLASTARYAKLSRLEAYLAGTQYDNLPDWHDERNDTPLRERRPCVIYPLPKAATNQAVRFTIGEGKFPRLKIDQVDASDTFGEQFAISADESPLLTKAVEDIVIRSRLRSALRVMMRRGLSCGTGVVVLSVHMGRFHFEHPRAKDCVPTFECDSPELPVKSLVWTYAFDAVVKGVEGKPTTQRFQFRRDFTETEVIEYEDVPIEVGSRKPIEWREKSRTVHGLGFCPVVWTRNLPDECGSDIDGVAIYDGLLDELDALNFALSQRHMGIEVLGTPQPYETGVADDDGPAATGRTAAPVASDRRSPYSKPGERGSSSVAARKGGARYLWSYKGDGVKVGLVETTGQAFEVASAHVDDIRSRLLEAMDIILLDPTSVAGKGDMSAKALVLMYAPMLALVDELREWWWEHALQPILSMMLRAVAVLGDGMLVKGARQVSQLLQRRSIMVDGQLVWEPPTITPLWGDYFAPSAEDVFKTTQSAAMAHKAKLVSASTATRFVASMYGVADVEDELVAIMSEGDAVEGEEPDEQEPSVAEPQADEPSPDSQRQPGASGD